MNARYWRLFNAETAETLICSGYTQREALENALAGSPLIGKWDRICDGYAYDVFGNLWIIEMV